MFCNRRNEFRSIKKKKKLWFSITNIASIYLIFPPFYLVLQNCLSAPCCFSETLFNLLALHKTIWTWKIFLLERINCFLVLQTFCQNKDNFLLSRLPFKFFNQSKQISVICHIQELFKLVFVIVRQTIVLNLPFPISAILSLQYLKTIFINEPRSFDFFQFVKVEENKFYF